MTSDNKKYDVRHGGPFNRGMTDSYYGRGYSPHYYKGGTGISERIEEKDMTADEIEAYKAGIEYNNMLGDFKNWK